MLNLNWWVNFTEDQEKIYVCWSGPEEDICLLERTRRRYMSVGTGQKKTYVCWSGPEEDKVCWGGPEEDAYLLEVLLNQKVM